MDHDAGVTGPFGDGVPLAVHRPGSVTGEEDLRLALEMAKNPSASLTVLTSVCTPTAAFSRRDALLDGHGRAMRTVVEHGFDPVMRPVGGHLAGYDEGSVVVHVWGPHPEARAHLRQRFASVAQGIVDTLAGLGVPDPRVGSVPGEYCEGEWSINAGGVSKLAGTGQRLFKGGFLFSAVLTVTRPERLRAMLVAAYADLGLELVPTTIGSIDDWVPDICVEDVRLSLSANLERVIRSSVKGPVARVDTA